MYKWLALLALCQANPASSNNEFSQFFNSFNTLEASFKQHTYNEAGVRLGSASGYLKFKRPAKLIWHTESPINQTLLLSNNELWLVDHELEQASVSNTESLNNTPLYWLINQPDELIKLPQLTKNTRGIQWYDTNDTASLNFGFKDGQLMVITLNNQLGQNIIINFINLKINQHITSDSFDLDLDADFDIIR